MSRVLDLMLPAHGQCRLTYDSATSLKLSPHNGRNLNINGAVEKIPSAGVTVSNSGLSASTLYYVYAYMNAGTMALELSATGHSQHTNGVEIKTGDSTRTLVGMARTNGSSQFVDDATNVCVLSYFNRRRKLGKSKFTANRSLAPATSVFTEVHTEIRVNFLTWADEPVRQAICGGWYMTGIGIASGYASIDNDTSGQRAWCIHSDTATGTMSSNDERLASEGYHFGSLTGNCQGGTSATWMGGQNGEVSQVLTVIG